MFYPHTIKGKVNLRSDIISIITPPNIPGAVFAIDTSVVGPGSSSDVQFQLPLIATEGYFFKVDWGDGNIDYISDVSDPASLHTYSLPGQYEIDINGIFPSMAFDGSGDAVKMVDWKEWNATKLSPGMFYGCTNLTFSSTDFFEVLGTSLENSFRECSSVVSITNIGLLNTILITDISSIFRDATLYNQDLNTWNTVSVTHAEFAFTNATAFNGNIASWITGSIVDTAAMFLGATSFNRDISSWNMTNIISCGGMFFGATSFNQPIGAWTTSSFGTLEHILEDATSFNQDISSWLVPFVSNMTSMLDNCGMDQDNYDKWLIALDAQTLQVAIPMGAAGMVYTGAGAGGDARANLVGAPDLMIITGDAVATANYFMSKFDPSYGVSVPDDVTLDMTNDFSGCAWVYLNNTNIFQRILSKYIETPTGNKSWFFDINSFGNLHFQHSTDGTSITFFNSTVTVPFSTRTLAHFRLTGGTLYVGINGDMEQSVAKGACFAGSAPIDIGQIQSSFFSDDFDITQPMLFNSGLSEADFATIYNGGEPLEYSVLEKIAPSITAASVMAFELSSNDTSCNDLSGTGNNGAFVGGSFTNGESITWQI